jgi:spore coat polysaccharide biosynthesis protein SpsF
VTAGAHKPLVIVQARTGSKRLPRKVVADLCGRPLLAWLVERVAPSRLTSGLVVATTTETADDPVEALCDELGTACFRGHPTDVLDRFVATTRAHGASAVVRLSGDSPLLDHGAVDAVVEAWQHGRADIAENHRYGGWPVGTAIEVVTADALAHMADEADDPRHREHVTLYAYETPDRFKIQHVPPPSSVRAGRLRLCVDTSEDLERVRQICASFAPRRDVSLGEIVERASRSSEL